jgi:hypothetical protein
MIWDSHSSSMEEPDLDEKEHAMGFRTGTTFVQDIFERAYRWVLGQVLGFNCLTWIFSLVLTKQSCFGQSHPPTPPHLSLVAPFTRSVMAMQKGGDVTTIQVYL